MKTTWILIANKTLADIFENNEEGNTKLYHTFIHLKGSLREGQLNSDRPGRFRFQTLNRENSSVNHLVDQFAGEITHFLEKGRTDNRFDKLFMVAGPKFSGVLLSKFNKNLKRKVEKMVIKEFIIPKKERINLVKKLLNDNRQSFQ